MTVVGRRRASSWWLPGAESMIVDRPGRSSSLRFGRSTPTAAPPRPRLHPDRGSGSAGIVSTTESGGERVWPLIMIWCPDKRAVNSWPPFGRTRTLNAATYCASMSSIPAGQRQSGQVASARDAVYGSDGCGGDRSGPAAKQMTAAADTNEPGSRRISADQRNRSSQAMDGAGHPERICKQGVRGSSPWGLAPPTHTVLSPSALSDSMALIFGVSSNAASLASIGPTRVKCCSANGRLITGQSGRLPRGGPTPKSFR